MKQLSLILRKPDKHLTVNYHHYLREAILEPLASSQFIPTAIHKNAYIHLISSALQGGHDIEDGHIIFTGQICLYIRSALDEVIDQLAAAFLPQKSIKLKDSSFEIISASTTRRTIKENQIVVHMVSPVCVIKREKDKGMVSRQPFDARFAESIRRDFEFNYKTFFGIAPSEDIYIEAKQADVDKEYVTEYQLPSVQVIYVGCGNYLISVGKHRECQQREHALMGKPFITANDFPYSHANGVLDDSSVKQFACVDARNRFGIRVDNSLVSVDEPQLDILLDKARAYREEEKVPLTFRYQDDDGQIASTTVDVSLHDRTVDISAWYGEFYLSGKAEYLDFLYHVGLGSQCVAGFGLFEEVGGVS